MFSSVCLNTTSIFKVVGKPRLQIKTERFENPVLYSQADIHGPLITRVDSPSHGERGIRRDDKLFGKRTVNWHFKSYSSCDISIQPPFIPHLIGHVQWYTYIIYFLRSFQFCIIERDSQIQTSILCRLILYQKSIADSTVC